MKNKKLISFISALAVAAGVSAPAFTAAAEVGFSGFKTEGGAALSTFTFSSDAASTTYTADLSGMTNLSLQFVFDDLNDSSATTDVYKNRPQITIGGKTIVIKPHTSNAWNGQWPGTTGADNGLYGLCWKPYVSTGDSPLTVTITAELSNSKAKELTVTASNVSGSKTISYDTATDLSTITLSTGINSGVEGTGTVSLTSFTADAYAAYSATFGGTAVSAKAGEYITVPSPAGEAGKTITGWKYGDTLYYPGDSVLIDDIKGQDITEVAYNSSTPLSFTNNPDSSNKARYTSVILGETVGLTSGTGNNTYAYSDSNIDVKVVTSAGDIITADNGIYFSGVSITDDRTSGAKVDGSIGSVGQGGRYILVKPAIDGTFGITASYTQTSTNVGRLYYADLGTGTVSTDTINSIDKTDSLAASPAAITQLGSDAGSKNAAAEKASFGTKTLDMTAGHTYIFVFYANNYTTASFNVTKMTYSATGAEAEPTATPRPDPQLQYLPEFSYAMINESLVTAEEADGTKATGFFASFTATHGGKLSKLGLKIGDDDKGVQKLPTSVTLADNAAVTFGVILDGVIADSTANIDMTANESSLAGKTVYAFGDSIVYGHNTPDKAFMNILAANEGMTLSKYAVNGATIVEKGSNRIITQVQNAPAAEPDYVVFEGYTNDAYPDTLEMGAIRGKNATEFNTSTFCGAFEHLIYTMKQKWPNANYVFVTIHKSGARDWNTQYDLRDKSIEICNEWGISVADIFGYTTLDTRDSSQMKTYIIGGSGSHPNEKACNEFYVPIITKVMKALD